MTLSLLCGRLPRRMPFEYRRVLHSTQAAPSVISDPHRPGGSSSDDAKKGVKVRIKNKGSQKHKRGRKRPKYQAPLKEHPQTPQTLQTEDIHANHLEAFNSALRRLFSCYRRRTNTYAKHEDALQRRLDGYWVLHNFVRHHFTTHKVPAVALGIIDEGFSFEELATIQRIHTQTN